jgi:hypothetical protein
MPADYRLTAAALPEPERARFLAWLLAHIAVTAIAVVLGLAFAWPLLPDEALGLTDGWLLLLVAFVALSACVRHLACRLPVGCEWPCLGAYALAWVALLLPLLKQSYSLHFAVWPLLACLAWRVTGALPAALTDHSRPGAAALAALAHVGAMPWDCLCVLERLFRWVD